MGETNSEILNIEIRADGLDDLQRIARELSKLGVVADTSSKKIRDASSEYTRAAKSTKAFESELRRLTQRAAEIPKRIEFINEELRELANAGDTGSAKVQALQQQLRRLTDEQRKMQAANEGATNSFRGVRGQMQNVSFQLTDFIVSLQNGQKATVAFTQQAPQLLAGFGPIYAAAGLAAAGLGALATVLFSTGKESEDAGEEVDKLADAMERAQSSVADFNTVLVPTNDYLDDLRKKLENVSGAARVTAVRLETITLDSARRDVQKAGRAIIEDLKTTGRTAGLAFARAFQSYEGEMQIADTYAEQEESINRLIFALSRQGNLYREEIGNLREYKAQLFAVSQQEEALANIRNREQFTFNDTSALDSQVKAYEDYNRALESVMRQADPMLAAQKDLAAQFEILDIAIERVGGASSKTAQQFVEARKELQAIFDERFNATVEVKIHNPTEDVLVDAWLADMQELENQTDEFSEALKNNVKDAAITATDALVDFALTGEQAFGDMVKSMLADLAKLVVRMQVMNALEASTLFAAQGYAFNSNGSLTPFAHGGVVTSPTLFGFGNRRAGIMGEAGPEAIMPLRRDSRGNLGVSGGGNSTVVNVINNAGGTANVSEQENGDGSREITVLIENAMETAVATGRMDKVLGANYGLRRQGY